MSDDEFMAVGLLAIPFPAGGTARLVMPLGEYPPKRAPSAANRRHARLSRAGKQRSER